MTTMIRSVCMGASAVLLAVGVAAQSGNDPKPGKTPPGQEKGRPAEASSARSAAAPIAIPIEGATEANAKAIETALESMMKPVWKCEGCQATSPTKATCKACSKEMTEDRSAKVFRDAEVDAASGELRVSLAPAQTVRVTEIDAKLQANSAKIDKRQLALPSFVKLHLATPAEAADAKATLEKSLNDSKLFSSVSVKEDRETKRLVALVETKGDTTFAEAASAVEKAGAGYQLSDVVMTAPCPGCAKNGNMQANCKGCWHDDSKS
jgi:hypothetical protein